jgi:hypothetical protein
MPSHRLLASILALVASLSAAAQDEHGDPACSVAPRASAAAPSAAGLTLPAAYAAQWGELANAFPFGTSQMRYQQVFLGSEIPGSVSVAGLGFREDDQGNRASGGVADLTVKLGLTTFDHATLGLTSNFDANYDVSGSTTVLNGRVNLPALSGQNTNLATFAVHLPCDVPYMLAPLAGQNLLLEVVNRGSDNTGFYDKVNANASVGTTTRIWATSATATTAGRGIRNDRLVLCLVRAGTCAAPAFASFGAGCQGSNGVPQHGAATLPALGSTHTLTLGTARPSTQAVLFADVQRATWGGVPLPLPLDFLGAVGCTLYVPGTLQVPVATDMLGNASVSLPVPNYASACGVRLFSQFIVVDPSNNLNLVTTNGAESRLGR